MKKHTTIHTDRYNYKGSKGIKVKGQSKTLQDDSLSIKDMLERHVQGVLDPSEMKDGQYHEDDITHDTDVSETQLKTELEALNYAQEHGMDLDQIQDFVNENQAPITEETQEEKQEEKQVTTDQADIST